MWRTYADERRRVDQVEDALLGVQLHTHLAQRAEFRELLALQGLIARELLVCKGHKEGTRIPY